jgi:mannose-6-phosphate isomerase-like protein (cupin superfamily)
MIGALQGSQPERREPVASSSPSSSLRIVDLDAELAKLTMFRRSPQSTPVDRKGSVARLADYRDGLLLGIKFSGKDHWERHLTGEELVYILDGGATLEIVCDDGPPRCFELRAGTLAVIPRGAWHRFLSSGGATEIAVTPFPGETIERDVDDPRAASENPAAESQMTAIIDLNAEAAKLTTFLGRTPRTTFAEREGSAVRLAAYRDGMLLLSKSAGKGHWETHPEDELLYVLDGALTVDIVEQDAVRSREVRAGMVAIVPPGTWHRVHSADAVTVLSATIPGEHIDLDVDDPRVVAR